MPSEMEQFWSRWLLKYSRPKLDFTNNITRYDVERIEIDDKTGFLVVRPGDRKI
jgi:hypothetical protein